MTSERLDALGSEDDDLALTLGGRLAHHGDRVRGDALPLDSSREDALEHREGLPDGGLARTRSLEIEPEARDALRRELAERDVPQARERMCVPDLCVAHQSRAGEVGPGVQLPPFLGELRKCLPAAVKHVQLAGPLKHVDATLEGLGVATGRAARERLVALGAVGVVPADSVDRVGATITAAPLSPLDHVHPPGDPIRPRGRAPARYLVGGNPARSHRWYAVTKRGSAA